MRIREDRFEDIKKALEQAEKGARARLFDAQRIPCAIEAAEKKLHELGVPKKDWTGCIVYLEPPAVPNSYGRCGSASGTRVTVAREKGGWYITAIERVRCRVQPYGGPERDTLVLSDQAAAAVPRTWRV